MVREFKLINEKGQEFSLMDIENYCLLTDPSGLGYKYSTEYEQLGHIFLTNLRKLEQSTIIGTANFLYYDNFMNFGNFVESAKKLQFVYSVPYKNEKKVFYRDVNIKEIQKSVIKIDGAFSGCTSLEIAPEIPSNVVSMSGAFNGCQGLTVTPKIQEGVEDMSYAFVHCKKLETIVGIPNTVTDLYYAFGYCEKLVNVCKIPNGVKDMSYTFAECTALEKMDSEIPSSVNNMHSTFYNCTNLTGEICINTNDCDDITFCFSNTTKPILLTGTSSLLAKLAGTSSEGNVTVKNASNN